MQSLSESIDGVHVLLLLQLLRPRSHGYPATEKIPFKALTGQRRRRWFHQGIAYIDPRGQRSERVAKEGPREVGRRKAQLQEKTKD